MDTPETELIKSALNGDAACFESLIQLHSRLLFAVAFAVLQNIDEAEEVVQETFISAWNKRKSVRDPNKFRGWLTVMTRNRACDLLRKRRTVPLDESHPEIPAASTPEPELTEKLNEAVMAAMSKLPEQHRIALTLRYLDDMDHRKIEETMGLTNGALRGILGRALATLRKTLKPALEAYE